MPAAATEILHAWEALPSSETALAEFVYPAVRSLTDGEGLYAASPLDRLSHWFQHTLEPVARRSAQVLESVDRTILAADEKSGLDAFAIVVPFLQAQFPELAELPAEHLAAFLKLWATWRKSQRDKSPRG